MRKLNIDSSSIEEEGIEMILDDETTAKISNVNPETIWIEDVDTETRQNTFSFKFYPQKIERIEISPRFLQLWNMMSVCMP